jgi:hypothetical protein
VAECAMFLFSFSDLHTDKNVCRYVYGTKEQLLMDFHKIASLKGQN